MAHQQIGSRLFSHQLFTDCSVNPSRLGASSGCESQRTPEAPTGIEPVYTALQAAA
jgi:hypothetical protein